MGMREKIGISVQKIAATLEFQRGTTVHGGFRVLSLSSDWTSVLESGSMILTLNNFRDPFPA